MGFGCLRRDGHEGLRLMLRADVREARERGRVGGPRSEAQDGVVTGEAGPGAHAPACDPSWVSASATCVGVTGAP